MSKARSWVTLPLCCAAGVLGALVAFGLLGAVGAGHSRSAVSRAQARAAYGRLPLAFEPNRGQAPANLDFVARGTGYALGLGSRGLELSLAQGKHSGSLLRMLTPGGQLRSPQAEQALPGRVSYFGGNDRSKWIHGAPTYGRVVYRNVWPGIDLAFHGRQGRLEYDLDLGPGARPTRVALRFAGARGISADGRGGATIRLDRGALQIAAPRASQDGRAVSSHLVLDGRTIGIALGAYDHARPLVVDPNLVYSTYLGGAGTDQGNAVAVDSSGDAYLTGQTGGSFPTTPGAYSANFAGSTDVFVSKLNPAGTALVYSTYLGSGDVPGGIAVDSSGSAYVTGFTTSASFPTNAGAFQTTYGGGGEDAFVTKLNPAGTGLTYSTYLGANGADAGMAIAVDSSGDAYLTGQTSGSFPTTVGAFQTIVGGGSDAFVAKLNPAGTALAYSTYLGGAGGDTGTGLAVDTSGNAYVAGYTTGSYPVTPGASQTTAGGNYDAFVTKVNAAGAGLGYSTYIGGSGADQAKAIAVDASGDAFVTGSTIGGTFPTTVGAYQTTPANAFVTRLSPGGNTRSYSTYLGGSGYAQGNGIAVDASGNAYVSGYTNNTGLPGPVSTPFPTTSDASQPTYGGAFDAFLSTFNPAGTALTYSTFLGGSAEDEARGIAVDAAGSAYLTGYTNGGSFPTTAGAAQTTFGGATSDAFVSKLGVPAQTPPPTDSDGDGIPNSTDNCPTVFNPTQADSNHNGVGDACEPDLDGDGVPNSSDNCPTVFNPTQADSNHNGVGDACEPPSLQGRVTTKHAALGGATVVLCPASGRCEQATTDGNGHYVFGPGLAGRVSLRASAGSDTVPQDATLTLSPSGGAAQDFDLQPNLSPPDGTTIGGQSFHGGAIPNVVWTEPFDLEQKACLQATVNYEILVAGRVVRHGPMPRTPEDPTLYRATVQPLAPSHGFTSVRIDIVGCTHAGGGSINFGLYIDPSGTVRDLKGRPVYGATVRLYRSDTPAGSFTLVPNGSPLMSFVNRHDPDRTDANGHFGWDVVPGYYKVQAAKRGCRVAKGSTQTIAQTSVLTIPPAVLNLSLRLDCPYKPKLLLGPLRGGNFLVRHGRAYYRLTNRSPFRIGGTLSFRSGRTTVGTHRFALPANRSGDVAITLTGAARTLLAKRPALKATAQVKATGVAGTKATAHRGITLRRTIK